MKFLRKVVFNKHVDEEDIKKVIENMGCKIVNWWYPFANVTIVEAFCNGKKRLFLPKIVRVVEELELYELSEEEAEKIEEAAEYFYPL